MNMKMMIKKGDIGFAMTHDNWLSRAIAWFMGSSWSHTFLVLHVTEDRIYTVETSNYEVCIHSLDYYLKNPNCTIAIYQSKTITDEQRNMICNEALNVVQTNYGWLQLLSFGIRRILKRIGIDIRNFIRQGMVCTAVPLLGYKNTHIQGLKGIDPESIDTEELYYLVRIAKTHEKQYEFDCVYAKQKGTKK
jgi:hypothetical protein